MTDVSALKVVFRVDASLQIGSGHVMRCLTLADALKALGAQCEFVCREHPGQLFDLIDRRGYSVHALPLEQTCPLGEEGPIHAPWLGATQKQDVEACKGILQRVQPDWLVVDHYGLDSRWERALKPFCRNIMVIDDLADRPHYCDLLLDQNLGRRVSDYLELVPAGCSVLAGPQYALLRPEFAALREYSLKRRKEPQLRNILITMGGVDQRNATSQVLEVLKQCPLPEECRVTVVMGSNAPWLEKVRLIAAEMPWPAEVVVNVSDMAERMADCDLAIGAAGSTSWERCCLGVPALIVILADNQAAIGKALQRSEAAMLMGMPTDEGFQGCSLLSLQALMESDAPLRKMSKAAADVADGRGSDKVAKWLLNQ